MDLGKFSGNVNGHHFNKAPDQLVNYILNELKNKLKTRKGSTTWLAL